MILWVTCSRFFVYSPVFSHDFIRYRLLLFLFHSLEVHLMNSYNNNHSLVVVSSVFFLLSLSLMLSKHRKYRGVTTYSFVLFIGQCYNTGLLTAPQGTITDVKRWTAVSITRENFARRSNQLCGIFEIEKNWKENWKELNQADNWFCSRGYELNYTQLCWLCLCWLCASFCDTEWRLFDVW